MQNPMLKEIHRRQEDDYKKYVAKRGVHGYIELIKADVTALRKNRKNSQRTLLK